MFILSFKTGSFGPGYLLQLQQPETYNISLDPWNPFSQIIQGEFKLKTLVILAQAGHAVKRAIQKAVS